MPQTKVILFMGPPLPSSVTEASCTINDVDDSFNAFLGLKSNLQKSQASTPTTRAAWRSLPLHRQPLRFGDFSQTHKDYDASLHDRPHFFNTAHITNTASQDLSLDESIISAGESFNDVLTQFREQSLAAHASFLSQDPDQTASQSFETSVSEDTTTSLLSTARSANQTGVGGALPLPPAAAHLSDLEDIPPAARILELSPQTVTVNLIVGIISIAQPRAVTTRWGSSVALVEVLVGDDTESGFAITFWLGAETDKAAPVTSIEHSVRSLRRQDVVLMHNVALNVFRGKVYGQSLRRGLTKLTLLWRRGGGGHYPARALTKREAANHPQQEKTRQVRDWVLRFIGEDPARKRQSTRLGWDKPPDDTQ